MFLYFIKVDSVSSCACKGLSDETFMIFGKRVPNVHRYLLSHAVFCPEGVHKSIFEEFVAVF